MAFISFCFSLFILSLIVVRASACIVRQTWEAYYVLDHAVTIIIINETKMSRHSRPFFGDWVLM